MKAVAILILAAAACGGGGDQIPPPAKPPAPAPTATPTPAPAEQRIELTVTDDGFQPSPVEVKAGQQVTLVVTRKTEKTCATEIVIKDHGIEAKLPLDKPVAI